MPPRSPISLSRRKPGPILRCCLSTEGSDTPNPSPRHPGLDPGGPEEPPKHAERSAGWPGQARPRRPKDQRTTPAATTPIPPLVTPGLDPGVQKNPPRTRTPGHDHRKPNAQGRPSTYTGAAIVPAPGPAPISLSRRKPGPIPRCRLSPEGSDAPTPPHVIRVFGSPTIVTHPVSGVERAPGFSRAVLRSSGHNRPRSDRGGKSRGSSRRP